MKFISRDISTNDLCKYLNLFNPKNLNASSDSEHSTYIRLISFHNNAEVESNR